MRILNPDLGGKIRAVLTIIIAIATTVAAIVDAIDWSAAPAVIILAILQALTRFTPLGNKPQ